MTRPDANPYREDAAPEDEPFRVCAECRHYRTIVNQWNSVIGHECQANPTFGKRDPITGDTPVTYLKVYTVKPTTDAWPNHDGHCGFWKAKRKKVRRPSQAEREVNLAVGIGVLLLVGALSALAMWWLA